MSAPKQNYFETQLYSGLGLVAMFVLVVAFYIIIGALKVGADVTADKVHTLTPGTRHILEKLDSRLTIRFYCTQDSSLMPPPLRIYGQHVEDLLAQYKDAAKGKLVIQKLDPEPDSDAEDAALLNGMIGRQISPYNNDHIYMGIIVSLLDDKFVLPWLPPDRERFLEYDISRAIARVVNRTPPTVGIMTVLPVFGEAISPMMMTAADRGKDPWAFVSELRKDFTVKEVPMSSTSIPADIKVLMVLHPRGITDATQSALDQFVLRGGKLIAFIDPRAFFDQTHEQQYHAFQVIGDASGQSALDKLLPAWGLSMDMDKVAVDMTFATRNPRDNTVMPTILTVNRQGINQEDAAIGQIDNLLLPFIGSFRGTPANGLKETVLVSTTRNAQMVDSLLANNGNRIRMDFKPENTNLALAVHLTGKFKTAFPTGTNAGALKESTVPGNVVLIADTDLLNDKVCVQIQNDPGGKRFIPTSGNLNFVQSLVDEFAGDDDLITARNRASQNRLFTRVKEMQAKAGQQWEERIHALEAQQREVDKKIGELQSHNGASGDQAQILSADQEHELANFQHDRIAVMKDLKGVRKQLAHDTEAMSFWTKIINIGAMPVVVALSGVVLALVKRKRRAAR